MGYSADGKTIQYIMCGVAMAQRWVIMRAVQEKAQEFELLQQLAAGEVPSQAAQVRDRESAVTCMEYQLVKLFLLGLMVPMTCLDTYRRLHDDRLTAAMN